MSNKIKIEAEASLPTSWGDFNVMAIRSDISDYDPHLILKHEGIDVNSEVLLRIHSECITGDLFHSKRCDCGQQLDESMKLIAAEKGLLIYLRQEGRGIGIIDKLKAYNKQDEGMDTIEANKAIGRQVDERAYDLVITILEQLGIKKVRLLTNNPDKIAAFDSSSIDLIERIPLEIKPEAGNSGYLKTKKEGMGHLLSM